MGKAAKKSVPTGKAAQITGKGAAAPPQIKDPFTQLWRHVRRDVARVAQKYNLVAVLQATVLIAFLSARQLSKWWVEEPVISCAEDQPLYERTPQLFIVGAPVELVPLGHHHALGMRPAERTRR